MITLFSMGHRKNNEYFYIEKILKKVTGKLLKLKLEFL
jgi:hypothetical protein